MKVTTAKKALVRLGVSCLVSLMSLLPAASASAQTYPYLKSYGADVSAGGAFDASATNNSGGCATNFQDGSSANPFEGGILTYDNGSGNPASGGASSQYGAFALGNIDATSGSPNGGFYSDGAQAGSVPNNQLSFANISNLRSSSGGQFDASGGSGDQCIPDYYDTYGLSNPTTINTNTNPVAGYTNSNGQFEFFVPTGGNKCAPNGVYYVDATTLPGGYFDVNQGNAQNLCDGSNIAIIVKGNVVVSNDIHYPPGDVATSVYNATNLPKFVVVAQGNIYIAPNVRDLAGWYVAQPAPSTPPTPPSATSTSGIIWDCFPRDTTGTSVLGPFIASSCDAPLLVQGALTAEHINFLRSNGNVLVSNTSEDKLYPSFYSNIENNCDVMTPVNCNIGEFINYPPNMVVGGGFFNQTSTTTNAKIESLISLPPVF